MPVVPIDRDELFRLMGRDYTEDEFQDLCFAYGIELDEVTQEKIISRKSDETEDDEKIIYKIDVPANRYDLLCIEGIVRALKIFLGLTLLPSFKLSGKPTMQMFVKKSCSQIRPYCVCAVLRNVNLGKKGYNSFLDLQDKLHFNICRQRSLVAIGTHDLSTITPPFTYSAESPDEISFIPLSQSKMMTARQILDMYRDDSQADFRHLKPYTDLIYNSPVYPVIRDSKNVVLSLPPIINGEHSKMDINIKDIFIECTGKDYTRTNIVLNQLVTIFSEYCGDQFMIEPVEVIYEDIEIMAKPEITPNIAMKEIIVKVSEIIAILGKITKIENDIVVENILTTDDILNLIKKMQLKGELLPNKEEIRVYIPPTRGDIMHAIDVIEDVAIAYGYNNIVKIPVNQGGKQQPINKLTDMLRKEIIGTGFQEILTLSLCSHTEAFEYLNHIDDGNIAVLLSNPKTMDFEIVILRLFLQVRPLLIPGMLKTIRENKSLKVKDGLRLFEISDIVIKDHKNYCGARNERHFAAGYAGLTAGLEVIHGLVDFFMRLLNIAPTYSECPKPKPGQDSYKIVKSDDPMYFPGRSADIILIRGGKEIKIGNMGIIHPEVIEKYNITVPCSTVEINIEHF